MDISSSSIVAGFVTATTTTPVDVIKTRVMNAPRGLYAGPWDCVKKSIKADGWTVFTRGWTGNLLRFGPHFIFSFPLYEQLRRLFGAGYLE
jgi:dicarboxylate transporter 10